MSLDMKAVARPLSIDQIGAAAKNRLCGRNEHPSVYHSSWGKSEGGSCSLKVRFSPDSPNNCMPIGGSHPKPDFDRRHHVTLCTPRPSRPSLIESGIDY